MHVGLKAQTKLGIFLSACGRLDKDMMTKKNLEKEFCGQKVYSPVITEHHK
jgi:hypothetical protein